MKTEFEGLYRIRPKDYKKAARTLADAFEDYPLFSSLEYDREKRIRIMMLLFTIGMRSVQKNGAAFALSPDIDEVAGWQFVYRKKSGVSYVFYNALDIIRLANSLGARDIRKLLDIFNEVDKKISALNLPQNVAYLDTLGVKKNCQGQKRAKKLLAPVLAAFEAEQKPVFLSTNHKINVHIYEKFGFRVLKESVIKAINLPIWFMIKP